MNIYKLMQKHGLEHGLEVDQRHLDAFVKELEEVMSDVIGGSDLLTSQQRRRPIALLKYNTRNSLRAIQRYTLNLFFNKGEK